MPPDHARSGDLFGSERRTVPLSRGAVLLSGYATDREEVLLAAITKIADAAPFRRMATPGGGRMSVAMTSCGDLGWVTDRSGYRYTATDPGTGRAWPDMPHTLRNVAAAAAEIAGYPDFEPDSCLLNRYEPGSRMGLHQDKDEQNFAAPIVSVSLGLTATFLWGGAKRADRPLRLSLQNGDVVVWGGPARLTYHGIDTLRGEGNRLNLTFRKAR